MSTHTKSMCIGVRGGVCELGATVQLKPCDLQTADLAWFPHLVTADSPCADDAGGDGEEAVSGNCVLTVYYDYGFQSEMAKYGTGKFNSRKYTFLQLQGQNGTENWGVPDEV